MTTALFGALGLAALSRTSSANAATGAAASTTPAIGVLNLIGTCGPNDLRSNAPPVTGCANVVVVLGYWSVGDGGGGLFVWVPGTGSGGPSGTGATTCPSSPGGGGTLTSPDDGGTIIVPDHTGGAPGGHWLRIFDGALDVSWFGASPSATADQNVIAFNRAIAAAGQIGRPVEIPGGATYFLNSTILIDQYSGLTLRGSGNTGGGGHNPGTILAWDTGAPSNIPLFRVKSCCYCTFESFTIHSDRAYLSEAFRIVQGTNATVTSTHNTFRDLRIDSITGKNLGIGFRMEAVGNDEIDSNNDLHNFENCYVTGYTQSAARIVGYEAINEVFRDCDFRAGPYAVYVAFGSMHFVGGMVGYHTEADFFLTPGSTTSISKMWSENSVRFITSSGYSANPFPITISECHWDGTVLGTAQDTQSGFVSPMVFINFEGAGPFIIENCILAQQAKFTGQPPTIQVYSGNIDSTNAPNSGTYGFVCTGNTFLYANSNSASPFRLAIGGNAQIHIAGNVFVDANEVPAPMAQLAAQNPTPNVFAGTTFYTQNTKPTTITNFISNQGFFDFGGSCPAWSGQQITIVFNDNLTTIQGGFPICLANGEPSITPSGGSVMTFVYDGTMVYGTRWLEVSRSLGG